MIQLSYLLVGPVVDASIAEAVAPLRVEPLAGGVRVTGVWPHRDLAAARRQVASWLGRVPADQIVRCNLTGRERAAAAWVDELRQRPSASSVFEARHAVVDGRIFARLFGAYTFGESDIVLVCDEGVPVGELYRFMMAWAEYRLRELTSSAPAELVWDRPFPWGYWLVSFAESDVGDADFWALLRESLRTAHLREAFDARMQAPSPHVVIEAADPADPDQGFVIGLTAALGTSARQRSVAERHGVDAIDAASAQDAAGFCDRVYGALEAGERAPLFAYREAARGPLDSGWRVGCLDPEHRHDHDTLRIAPLSRAAVVPGLTDYLALPAGWVVTFEDDAFWLNRPGEAESHRDGPGGAG